MMQECDAMQPGCCAEAVAEIALTCDLFSAGPAMTQGFVSNNGCLLFASNITEGIAGYQCVVLL